MAGICAPDPLDSESADPLLMEGSADCRYNVIGLVARELRGSAKDQLETPLVYRQLGRLLLLEGSGSPLGACDRRPPTWPRRGSGGHRGESPPWWGGGGPAVGPVPSVPSSRRGGWR